jgi:hypothetical protein
MWFVLRHLQEDSGRPWSRPSLSAPHEWSEIAEACESILADGRVPEHQLFRMSGSLLHRHFIDDMSGTREQRVLVVEEVMRRISPDQPKSLSTEFVLGYLLSLCEPGSLNYSGLVYPVLDRFPTVLIWYGLCAGLHGRGDLLSDYDGLGRRLMRDVLKESNLLDRPECDIAAGELEVLAEDPAAIEQVRVRSSRNMQIEVAPLVTALVSTTPRSASEQLLLFGDKSAADAPSLRTQLGRIISDLNELYSKLGGDDRTDTRESKRKGRRKP